MPLTLIEASKQATNPLQSAVIEQFAKSSDILGALPFNTISGNALRYNREEILPGVAFRGVNEAFTESTGVLNPITEPLVIAGGDLDVDKFILDTMGEGQRGIQEAMKIKALALKWTQAFLKGDSTSDPRNLDGLQTRVIGNQLISAGNTSGGDVLTLMLLDQLIDQVVSPTHLIMNKTMRRRLSAAARSSSVGGNIVWERDAFGRQAALYNDLPILIADEDNEGSAILPFTESGAGGGTAQCTSLYCVSFGEGMLQGLQNKAIDVRDLGEIQTKPVLRTRIEWYCGMAIFHGKAVARLKGVKDGAVTA